MKHNFESHIEGEKPVIVDFSAKWCEPCKLITPVLHEVKKTVGERAVILTIDIDEDTEYSHLYKIQSVPTLIIFKSGNIVWRKNGITEAREILEHLDHYIS